MFKIDPNFWKDVEDPDKLKYVIYGDSIAKDEEVLVGLKENNYELDLIRFDRLWRILSEKINSKIINEKEYLYITDEVKVVTYIDKEDIYECIIPIYLMRHLLNKNICKLNFDYSPSIKVTYDHSLLTYKNNKLIPIKTSDATQIVVALNTFPLNTNSKEKYLKNTNRYNCNLINIKNKIDMLYDDYVYDFSVPKTQNFIVNGYIIHNTDSLYTSIPSLEYTDFNDANNKVTNISNEINDLIKDLMDNFLLPKMGVDKKYNKTNFKIESVISQMLLLGIKKNYAYKEIAKKGEIYSKPEIKYTGIPVVRSDYSKFAQDFIRKLIEDIALTDKEDKLDLLTKLASERYNTLQEAINNLDIKYIGTPGRWKESKYKNETFTLVGMRLYNTIYDTEIFRPGFEGLSVPIIIKNPNEFIKLININKYRHELFLNNTSINNITYIVIPSNFEKEELHKNLIKYTIELDKDTLWEKNYSKIARNIVDVIKKSIK